ncbi:MAG: hypothetical protein AAFX94_11725 [Myxococcota bacterium]
MWRFWWWVILVGCGSTLDSSSGGSVACQSDAECPGELRCQVVSGVCLEPPFPALEVDSVEATSSNVVRIRFVQDLDPSVAIGRGNFIISRLDAPDDSLEVNGVLVNPETPREISLVTSFQLEGQTYRLQIFNLAGIGGEAIGDGGVSTQFTGFSQTAIPRELQIIAPQQIEAGQGFSVTVNAINSNDRSFYIDMFGTLSWSSGGTGTFTVIDSPGWLRGTQTFVLRYDGVEQAETITLRAVWDQDATLTGASDPVDVQATNILARFQVDAPTAVRVNTPFPITLTALGSAGRPVTDYTGQVTLTGARGPARRFRSP